jgi:quercetin dioxygenase-like cupin family protein
MKACRTRGLPSLPSRACYCADGKGNPLKKTPTIARIQVGSNVRLRLWKYREESTMSNEEAAPETKGVTTKLLASVDLGPEIEGMAGRQLRMRMVTIEPGGVFGPIHDHKDRPGIVYILQGTITDHRNGVATEYGPGVGWPEDRYTTHWLENKGTIPAVEISVDIVRQE